MSVNHLTPKEAYAECMQGAIIIDLRRDYEIAYKSFDVPNIIFTDINSIKNDYIYLEKEQKYIIADNAGLRSKEICEFLIEQNFSNNIYNLASGMFEWDSDNCPIKVNNKELLTGSCLCMMSPMNKLKKNEGSYK